jgi:hypothetical protein
MIPIILINISKHSPEDSETRHQTYSDHKKYMFLVVAGYQDAELYQLVINDSLFYSNINFYLN